MDTVLRQWKKGLEVEVDIESVSFGGQGIARLEGLVVFVNGGYTGDRVRVRLTKIKKSFAEARVVEVLQPSGDRTIPPCSHFGICGGCKMQDLEYAAQLEIKRSNVEDVFERIGKFSGVKVPTPLASPRLFRYRNKMEFTFGDRPWLLADRAEPVSDFALGLHIPQRYDKVLNIDECHLATPVVNRVLHVVGEFARQSGLPAYSVKTHDGFWRFLVVREGVHTGQLMVNIITSRGDAVMQERLRSEIPAAVPEITSLINGISSSKSQVAQSEEEIILAGNPIIEEILGPDRFEISPGSFFQTNTDAAEMLYQTALSMAELTGTEVVYDLYSGTGSIAIFVSRYARHIVGMEYVTESVRDAIRNAERNGIHNCEFHGGDLKDTLRNFSSSPDVVIVDPPRSGLHPDVIESLLEMNTRRIVYVSCNPATQARDLEILCRDRYTLDRLQPVDMFPHTFHIENVAQLTRR